MRIVLSALAAKYMHSALAIRYLKSHCHDEFPGIRLREFTINQTVDSIVASLFKDQPSVLGFSCYIWNIEKTLRICHKLKMVLPTVKIILGGPEVSYDANHILKEYSCVDYIIRGEGEIPFLELLRALSDQSALDLVPSLAYRISDGNIIETKLLPPPELNEIASPYVLQDCLDTIGNRIVYYECTRGCPFNCAYCLSGTTGGVRFQPIDKVKRDIDTLVELGVRQVKFVDRTFNCNPQYALTLFRYLSEKDCRTTFHFEICADILNDTTIEFLRKVVPGKFQFEIGIQSTNKTTLRHIRRADKFSQIREKVTAVRLGHNIHQHLDLIAGLPFEDCNSLQQSFNDTYSMHPDMLQLGFLKMLKGSHLRDIADEYGYIFDSFPPYEVLETPWLSYRDILDIKDIEHVLDMYYNSGLFRNTLQYILSYHEENPFLFYSSFATFFRDKGYMHMNHRLEMKYEFLHDFATNTLNIDNDVITELVKLDMLLHMKHRRLPSWCNHYEPQNFKRLIHSVLGNDLFIDCYLPHFQGIPVAQVLKHVHIEVFCYDVLGLLEHGPSLKRDSWLLFDYSRQRRGYFENQARVSLIDQAYI